MIYLDYNATAPLRDAARQAMTEALTLANPSSVHGEGRKARAVVEQARSQIAASLNVKPVNVVFTASATEANHLALKGLGRARLLVSAIEHDSIRANADNADIIPVTPDGVIDLDGLEELLQANDTPALIAVMAVSNETGVIQPVEAIAALAKKYNALFHCDAVQAFGRLPLDYQIWGADSLSLSAHKLGGPKGVGALIVRDGLPVTAQIKGGGQEQSRRAGTENVPAIAGFGAIAKDIASLCDEHEKLRVFQERLENALAAIDHVAVYGQKADRIANTTLLTLQGIDSATQLMALDLAGFAVSSGSACSSGKVKPSHVLSAMNVSPETAGCAVRISTGWQTETADIDGFIQAFQRIARRLDA